MIKVLFRFDVRAIIKNSIINLKFIFNNFRIEVVDRIIKAVMYIPSSVLITLKTIILTVLKKFKFGIFLINCLKFFRGGIKSVIRLSIWIGGKEKIYKVFHISHPSVRPKINGQILVSEEKQIIPPLKFISDEPNSSFPKHEQCSVFPKIIAYHIKQGFVYAGTDYFKLDDMIICQRYTDYQTQVPFEEMHGIITLNKSRDGILWRDSKRQQPKYIEKGIYLSGALTTNYIHWLTEALPKIALIEEHSLFEEYPVIVLDELHENIVKSLSILTGNRRKIIKVQRNRLCKFGHLVALSDVSMVPFEFRAGLNANSINTSHTASLFSKKAIGLTRERILKSLPPRTGYSPKKIYIRRNNLGRDLENSEEVESFLLGLSFTIVEPEKLSFVEQLTLFSNAEVIVGQGGAALGNIIFAPQNCRTIVLTVFSPYTIHYYFANLAAHFSSDLTQIFCKPAKVSLGSHKAHMGMTVDIKMLKKVIQE